MKKERKNITSAVQQDMGIFNADITGPNSTTAYLLTVFLGPLRRL